MRDKLVELGIKGYKWLALRHALGPRALLVETTKVCNLRCPGCRRNYELGSISTEPGDKHLTPQLLKRAIEGVPIRLVRFEGDGEPMMNPYLKECLGMLRQLGIKSMMTTNGTLLNEGWVKFLEESGMMRIHISFDGASRGVYEKYRVGADYEKVVYNCKLLGRSGIQFFMSVVLFSDEIVDELPKYVELAKSVGATGIHYMKPQLESLEDVTVDLSRHEGAINEFGQLCRRNDLLVVGTCSEVPTFTPCYDPFIQPFVLLNGDVYGCTYMAALRRKEVYMNKVFDVPYQNYRMGNIYNDCMRSIWFGDAYKELRKRLQKDRRRFSGKKMDPNSLLKLKEYLSGKGPRFLFCDGCLCQWGESGL